MFYHTTRGGGSLEYTYDEFRGKETFGIIKAPTMFSLTFEVPSNATISRVVGFGPNPIPVRGPTNASYNK